MTNAVFILPSWTCSSVVCGAGTAAVVSAAAVSVLGESGSSAQATCCESSCAAWHAGGGTACASDTRFMTRLSETVGVGGDPQALCCTAQCVPGTWVTDVATDGCCDDCPPGKISTAVDATACTECVAGEYPSVQSDMCHSCTAGQYDHDQSATTPCQECAAGSYSAVVGALSCDGECPVGSFGDAGAHSSNDCVQCAAGQHDHDLDAATPCLLCLPGFFSATAGQTECSLCAAGMTAIGGSVSCSPPEPSFAAANCPSEWTACRSQRGCEDALAEAMIAPSMPTSGSTELLAMLDCISLAAGFEESVVYSCDIQFNPLPLTHADAEAACVESGGHLASVHSQQDYVAIEGAIPQLSQATAWIGLNDREYEMGCYGGGSGPALDVDNDYDNDASTTDEIYIPWVAGEASPFEFGTPATHNTPTPFNPESGAAILAGIDPDTGGPMCDPPSPTCTRRPTRRGRSVLFGTMAADWTLPTGGLVRRQAGRTGPTIVMQASRRRTASRLRWTGVTGTDWEERGGWNGLAGTMLLVTTQSLMSADSLAKRGTRLLGRSQLRLA